MLRCGQSLAEVQRLLVPASWQRALRACAAAEVVTTDLFDKVIRRYAEPAPPELTDLAEQGLIEPDASDPAGWRVPQAQAASWMHDWHVGQSGSEIAPRLAELESELARWHEELGNRNEQLRHLLVADPQQASSLFRQMFHDADGKRDFACCQDLLDVLADPNRIVLAGPEVSELRLDRAGYLRARLYWATDYSRSAQFLMPPGLLEQTERLLADVGPRVWQLFAAGGTGKTIQLQWLAARYCVTASEDIPCARIDFDVFDPVNMARSPWLLLLEVADQLDRRWPRRVFERLDRFSSYRSLARRLTAGLTSEAAHGLADLNAEDVQLVTEIFVRRLNDAADDRPIVLILDTLEEMLLGGAGGIDRLIGLLGVLIRECPRLRLVLAGRYDLRRQAPQAMAELGPTESVELVGFTTAQVSAYLRDIRGITGHELHDAVISRTGGQPFLVALFADIIEEDPEISSSELLRLREPATQWLIDRVIRRIKDPDVRWLVRYGVVPRRLRFDDVVAVMWSFLARGRSGPSHLDDPRDDQHHLPGRDDVFPFGKPPQDDAALAAVWKRLLSYAARPSWVSPAGDGQSVVFHPNVRAPMRDLISHRPVFRELHEAFRRRFELLAEESPESRSAYLREAVYHRVQVAAPDVADFWRTQIIRCRDNGDLEGVEELADELLREDYVEDDLPRRRSDGEPLLPYQMLAEAHVLKAYVAAERARALQAGLSDPLWSAVQRSLAGAAFVRDHSPHLPGASALEVALQAALLVAVSKPAEAAVLAEGTLAIASDDSRVDLLRVIGDARAALGEATAAKSSYRAALKLAVARRRADQQDAITLSRVSQWEAQGRLDKAVEWVGRLERRTANHSVGAQGARYAWQGRLLIECYEPSAALQLLADAHVSDLPAAVDIALVRAQAYHLLGRADHALGELQAAAGTAEQLPTVARYAYLARVHQLRGVVLGELLAVDEAEDCFELAFSLWGEIGFSEGHPECSYAYRRFLIRDVGDAAAASRVARPTMRAESQHALLWDEQTAELRGVQRRPSRKRLTDSDVSRLTPRQTASVIAARLARSWPHHRYLLSALVGELRRIRPPSARLIVLEELRRCEQANAKDIKRLRALFESTAPRYCDDAALQQSLLAELDRLQGNHARAGRALDEAVATLPAAPAARLARWRWLRTRSRLRAPVSLDQVDSLMNASTDYPLLRAASLFTLASASRASKQTRAMLKQGIAICTQIRRPTRWAADLFWALGRQPGGDKSLLASSADIDRQLGRPHRPVPPDWSSRILRDRRGEQAADLPGPWWDTADLVQLQRRLVADWSNLAREMGDALFGESAGLRQVTSKLKALRLQSDEVAVQAMPWELAIPPPRVFRSLGSRWPTVAYRSLPEAAARIDTRWLQRALCSMGLTVAIDGVLGPNTLDMLRRVTSAARPPLRRSTRAEFERCLVSMPDRVPLAVLLRPEAYAEGELSSHQDWGFDVTDLYRRAGFDVRTVSSLPDISPASQDQVSVLHVTGPMDMGGAGPYFDFSPTEARGRLASKLRAIDIYSNDIARWLQSFSPGQEPLVVLDPPYPGSRYDVPWQLVLRNLFAATLFANAIAPAIIATGVQASGVSYITPIARGIVNGKPLAEIADDLCSASLVAPSTSNWYEGADGVDWESAAGELAALATAIFAAPSAYTLPREQ